MLSEARAERLARRADRGTADGSRPALARRAWQRLTAAGDRGDQRAVEAVWQAWLRRPADDLWRVLNRWRAPEALTEAAFTAAVEPDRGLGERAAIGAFCTRHGLAPDGVIRRALFYVLTGQAAQHRAADPDGTLLASAYRRAGQAAQAALRAAIADGGDLDLVRVVAGAGEPGRAQHITAEEREYLTSQLAARRDWDGLWRLVKDLPLADAVGSMPFFGDRWRPDGDRDRALFDQLNHSDTRVLAAARAALDASVVERTGLDDHAVAGSFSPDGRRLAVATRFAINVFEMPGLTLAERYALDVFGASRLLHVGDAVIACSRDLRWYFNQPSVLIRYAGGRGTVVRRQACLMLLARHPAGFAVLHVAGGANQWHREGGYRLELRTASGAPLRDVSLPADLGFPGSGRGPWMMTADPGQRENRAGRRPAVDSRP